MTPIFTVHRDALVGERVGRLERRADEPGRPAGVRDGRGAALLGHVQAAGRHDASGAVRNWIAWNEPNNPVFLKPQYVRSGAKWVMQSAKDYARMCNAVVRAVKSVSAANKVACGVTAPRGNNHPGTVALVGLAARVPAGDEARRARRGSTPTPTTRTTATRARRRPRRRRPASAAQPPTAVTLGNFEVLTKELPRLYGNMRIWVTEYGYQTNPPDTLLRRHARPSRRSTCSRRGTSWRRARGST